MVCKQNLWTIIVGIMNKFSLDFIFHYIRFHEREFSKLSVMSKFLNQINLLSLMERMRRIDYFLRQYAGICPSTILQSRLRVCLYRGTVVLISIDINGFRVS
jgi:hypothetical protein